MGEKRLALTSRRRRRRGGARGGTSDPVQHAFRATVLGLSRFKCAANFDVIFFPSRCLKPLALLIIRAPLKSAPWKQCRQATHTSPHTPPPPPTDGPLTARHFSLSVSFSRPSVGRLTPPHFLRPSAGSLLLSSFPPLHRVLPPLTFAPTIYRIFVFLSLYRLFDRSHLPLPSLLLFQASRRPLNNHADH